MLVTVDDVSRSFVRKRRGKETKFWALKHVSFEVADGEMLTIIGPSGCGKSTLLNCIAGLTNYDEGTIAVDGATVQGPGPERAVVFQHASLLPWRTVERNVAFGLALQRQVPREQHAERVRKALELVGLGNFKDHYPGELSGGMQQRVNLARALATEPELLLMDEPFGALDALTKQALQDELAVLASRSHLTAIFITHDIEEAVYLGDRVLAMAASPGRVLEVIAVPFPHPRSREITQAPEFQALVLRLRRLLQPRATNSEFPGSEQPHGSVFFAAGATPSTELRPEDQGKRA